MAALYANPRDVAIRIKSKSRLKTTGGVGGKATLLPKTGSSGARVYHTPSGGIPARSGATLGTAACTLVTVSGGTRVVTTKEDDIYNVFLSDVSEDVDVIVAKIDGVWVVQAEDCSGG